VGESTVSNNVAYYFDLRKNCVGFNFFRLSECLSYVSRSEDEEELYVNDVIHTIQNEKLMLPSVYLL